MENTVKAMWLMCIIFCVAIIIMIAVFSYSEGVTIETAKQSMANGTFPAHKCDFVVNLPVNRKFVNIVYNGNNNYFITKAMASNDIAETLFVETHSNKGCNIKVIEHK